DDLHEAVRRTDRGLRHRAVRMRTHFHQELEQIEIEVLAMGELAERSVDRAVTALVHRDPTLAAGVIAADDEIDERCMHIEQRTLQVLALQTPVATDLRMLSAMLHINLHLERIGDQAVNISKGFLSVQNLPSRASVLDQLQEMGDIVRPMIRTAMEAFRTRD